MLSKNWQKNRVTEFITNNMTSALGMYEGLSSSFAHWLLEAAKIAWEVEISFTDIGGIIEVFSKCLYNRDHIWLLYGPLQRL